MTAMTRQHAAPDSADPNRRGAEVYHGLRHQILSLEPAEAGMPPRPDGPKVWGAVMDMGMQGGTATLVALADGSTSLYTSTGGGIIGGGFHQPVADATRALLSCLEDHLAYLVADGGEDLPGPGRVLIRALTYRGPMSAEAAEDDLGYGRHALSPVFHAAHDVITQLRIIDEQRPTSRR
jgi:hypothetical protein